MLHIILALFEREVRPKLSNRKYQMCCKPERGHFTLLIAKNYFLRNKVIAFKIPKDQIWYIKIRVY